MAVVDASEARISRGDRVSHHVSLKDVRTDRPLQWLAAAHQGYRACSQTIQTIELWAVALASMIHFLIHKQLAFGHNRVLSEGNSYFIERWRKTNYRNLHVIQFFRSFSVNLSWFQVLTLLWVTERGKQELFSFKWNEFSFSFFHLHFHPNFHEKVPCDLTFCLSAFFSLSPNLVLSFVGQWLWVLLPLNDYVITA